MQRSTCLLVICSALCAALTVSAATRYVNLDNPTPAAPFTSWATAATSIQDAVDVAMAGDEIVVTNGVYATGGRVVYGMSNRVAVTRPITLRSVNGPTVTSIVGSGPKGANAVRCVYLTDGAMLVGFTLTNGATQDYGDWNRNQSGGGVWCESASVTVSNCVLTGNSAYRSGGGAWGGTLYNCTLSGNSAHSGGGAGWCMVNNCTLSDNSAGWAGGGAYTGTLYNCTLTRNSAGEYGGGVYDCTLYNCTLTGNSARGDGGGAYSGTLNNCIVYYNSGRDGANYQRRHVELLLHYTFAF